MDWTNRSAKAFKFGLLGGRARDVVTMTAELPDDAVQTTDYIYGGSGTITNDQLSKVEYPNPSGGAADTDADHDVSYTYDNLGDQLTKTDQNGTTHTYTYDVLGRLTSDAAAVAEGNPENIDTSVLKLTYSFNALGLPYQMTSYNGDDGIVNQVEDEYNGLGQLIGQYEADSGQVYTSGDDLTPEVQYQYDVDIDGNPVEGSRMTSMIYPNGRILYYTYGSGLDSDISRLTELQDDDGADSAPDTVLEAYTYLGLDTIVQMDRPQSGDELTYIQQEGESDVITDGGDQYTGVRSKYSAEAKSLRPRAKLRRDKACLFFDK
jgi:YD repeat-containing protein